MIASQAKCERIFQLNVNKHSHMYKSTSIQFYWASERFTSGQCILHAIHMTVGMDYGKQHRKNKINDDFQSYSWKFMVWIVWLFTEKFMNCKLIISQVTWYTVCMSEVRQTADLGIRLPEAGSRKRDGARDSSGFRSSLRRQFVRFWTKEQAGLQCARMNAKRRRNETTELILDEIHLMCLWAY